MPHLLDKVFNLTNKIMIFKGTPWSRALRFVLSRLKHLLEQIDLNSSRGGIQPFLMDDISGG